MGCCSPTPSACARTVEVRLDQTQGLLNARQKAWVLVAVGHRYVVVCCGLMAGHAGCSCMQGIRSLTSSCSCCIPLLSVQPQQSARLAWAVAFFDD